MYSKTTYCPGYLKKQLVIDRLQTEIVRLKTRLRRQERTAKEGPFGSSTPSAKILLKANTPLESSQPRGGAKPGHRGHGRRRIPQDHVTRQHSVLGPERCPKLQSVRCRQAESAAERLTFFQRSSTRISCSCALRGRAGPPRLLAS
jgi:hypothetical protein